MHPLDQERSRKDVDLKRRKLPPPKERTSTPAKPLPAISVAARARGGNIPITTPPVEARVLNKMAFGPRPGDVDRVRTMGVAAYIEEQLSPETINDSAFDTMFAAQDFQLLDADVATLWARRNYDCPPEEPDCDFDYDLAYYEVNVATWMRAIHSKKQLLEVLVDHWHQHFNVRGEDNYAYYTWPDYHRRIRSNVFGNFRDFLEDIATSPAMLYYLDNRSSTAAGPNENYARELFELHTMGAEAYIPGISAPTPGQTFDGYRDWDVYEAARCFTGWTLRDRNWDQEYGDTGEFFFHDDSHDRFQKFLLGAFISPEQAPLKDGRDVLDRLAIHPATARHVAKRLARRLVSDEPSTSLIEAGAAAFLAHKDAPDQLRHVYRALLTHVDFTAVWGEKIKRPFESMVSALRATEAQWKWSNDYGWWSWSYFSSMGQAMWGWSPPNGYPDTRRVWLSSTRLVRRWTVLNDLCLDNMGDNDQNRTLVSAYARTPVDKKTPRQIVDYWVPKLLGYALSSAELELLYDFMARGRNIDAELPGIFGQSQDYRYYERVASLLGLILSLPAANLR